MEQSSPASHHVESGVYRRLIGHRPDPAGLRRNDSDSAERRTR
jgi:hypothetical protein